jgi:hypothetical protein
VKERGGGPARHQGGVQGGEIGWGNAQRAAEGNKACGRIYSQRDLEQATDGFSPLNKIGGGGFGFVYKGHLDGIDVAIKVCFCLFKEVFVHR